MVSIGIEQKIDMIQDILNKTKKSKNSDEVVSKLDTLSNPFNLMIANHSDCEGAIIELGKAIQQFRSFLKQNSIPKLSDILDSFVSTLELFLPCTNKLKLFDNELFSNDKFLEKAICNYVDTILFLLTRLAEKLATYLALINQGFNPSVVITLLVTSILAKLSSSILGFYILVYLDPSQKDGCFKICSQKVCIDQIILFRGIIGKLQTFANINSAKILVDQLAVLLKLVEDVCNTMINNFLTLLNLFLICLLETLAIIDDRRSLENVLDIFLYDIATFLQNLHIVVFQFNLHCTKNDACNISCFKNGCCVLCYPKIKKCYRRCSSNTNFYSCIGKDFATMYLYK
ncbi:MAG: hypothetical protein QXW79_00950 [Thermoplasmata archaeon]